MEVILKSPNQNYISTIVIGNKFFKEWHLYSYPSWLNYCKKHKLGLLIFKDDLINKNDPAWKKPTWQKLLIGKKIIENKLKIKNICFLDADIIINYIMSPNIFSYYNKKTLGVVSIEKNLPYPDKNIILKNISFGRHNYYSKKYPLDSAIFMQPKEVFKFHKFKKSFNDQFCAGLFIFNIKNHSSFLEKIFYKYDKKFKTLTEGDQPVLNYEFQKYGKLTWLDYKFQAIWIYEMAWKYPHLYKYKKNESTEVINCIESSLATNYFLHFAGSWYESNFWKNKNILKNKSTILKFKSFNKYLKFKNKATPIGKIKPNEKN
tara:strand:- start:162 stop:1115 length:954 start_codon:yes stop_codon:yes gene_type:complete